LPNPATMATQSESLKTMCHSCDSKQVLRANAVDRIDPTHTTMIRRAYEADLGKRLRSLRGAIVKKLLDQDALGLRVNYAFTRDSTKADSFMDWLSKEQGLALGIYKGAPSSSSDTHWSATYIDRAYMVGVGQAANSLRKGGATVEQPWIAEAFRRPIHADRAGILHTRNYAGLQGISAKIEASVAKVLTEGIINGVGAKQMARTINAQVVRYTGEAKRLARTEIINAHAESTLNSFVEAGIQGVEVEAEMLTAADACTQCMELKKKAPFKISEARGRIPVHPNCRCAWKPIVVNGTGINLR